MNILSQLFGVKVSGEIATAAKCLSRRDYAGFYNALPPDVQMGILQFILSKSPLKV